MGREPHFGSRVFHFNRIKCGVGVSPVDLNFPQRPRAAQLTEIILACSRPNPPQGGAQIASESIVLGGNCAWIPRNSSYGAGCLGDLSIA